MTLSQNKKLNKDLYVCVYAVHVSIVALTGQRHLKVGVLGGCETQDVSAQNQTSVQGFSVALATLDTVQEPTVSLSQPSLPSAQDSRKETTYWLSGNEVGCGCSLITGSSQEQHI